MVSGTLFAFSSNISSCGKNICRPWKKEESEKRRESKEGWWRIHWLWKSSREEAYLRAGLRSRGVGGIFVHHVSTVGTRAPTGCHNGQGDGGGQFTRRLMQLLKIFINNEKINEYLLLLLRVRRSRRRYVALPLCTWNWPSTSDFGVVFFFFFILSKCVCVF